MTRPTGDDPGRAQAAASGIAPEAARCVGAPWPRTLVGAMVALAVACGSPQQSSPAEAYTQFLDMLRVGEMGAAMDALLTPDDVALRQRMERGLRHTAQELTEGVAAIEPVEQRIDGDWALVVTRIERPRGADTLVQVRDEYLYRQDGQWKVVPEAVRTDPAVRPLVNASLERLFQWFREHREELDGQYGGRVTPM